MNNIVLIFLCLVPSSLGYKILCVFPAPARSHDNLGKGVVKSLLKAGHEVTWTTPFDQKDEFTNLTIIILDETRAILDDLDPLTPKSLSELRGHARTMTKAAGDNQKLRSVLIKEQFDAVITIWAMNDNEAGYAAIQQVPWILLSTVGYHTQLEWMMDEVRSVSTTPQMFNDCDFPMSLWNRLINIVVHVALSVDWWFDQTSLENLYTAMFSDLARARGVELPPFHDVQRNVSILLLNSHESIGYPASKPPNVLNIAGYHIDEIPTPLPNDLQVIMDNSPQGVIYFSMGSILRSANIMTGDTLAGLLRVFEGLEQTVLWKFEEKLDVKLPKNVHVRAWMPQQSILAHPNTIIFITHGGQLSTLEAVHAGVPLLAIPVMADQPANAERARRLGYAVKVDLGPNLVAEVDQKLKELLNNKTYYNRAKQLSTMFNARPELPSELIAHYVKIAIETKGAYHLRSASKQYSWVQLWIVDVLLLVLAVVFIIIAILVVIIKMCCRIYCGSVNKDKIHYLRVISYTWGNPGHNGRLKPHTFTI